MRHRFSPLFCWLLLFTLTAPLRAQTVETATAASIPWSGWWWPAKTGDLIMGYRGEPGALVKHDSLSGRHASQWEQGVYYHYDPAGPTWWGHCHAWAAAALLEPEPLHDVVQGGLTFHVGDLKGLLSEAHFSDHVAFFGQRNNGNPGDDLEDMYPLLVWSVLRQYIQENKTGLVFDLNAGPPVSSYPAFKYQVSYQSINADAYARLTAAAAPLELRPSGAAPPAGALSYQGEIDLWVSTFDVPPDYVGAAVEEHNYSFVFQAKDGQLVPGSDHWIGPSLQDHPDFAWYPTERVQENTELDYTLVSELNQKAR